MGNPMRTTLEHLFQEAVSVADPMRVVPAHLPDRPKGRLVVIGAGKASARMAEAVETVYGPCDGLVITRYGYQRVCSGIEVVQAAHPVPDAAGVDATRRMLAIVSDLGADDLVLVLISGGGSALLCAPAQGLGLADKIAINEALLASGAPIGDMNLLRKHLSCVKGGQLAAACFPARVVTLMISDVAGDDPADIASGPTVGDRRGVQAARDILARYKIKVDQKLDRALSQLGVLDPTDPLLQATENIVIAAPSQSLAAAARLGRAQGYDVRVLADDLEGEARDLGREHAAMAIDIADTMAPDAAPILLLSGGECTVTRHGDGVGGPNAEYALAAALALGGHPRIHLLACDTDGVDGAAEVAGAYVGPQSLIRARTVGADPLAALDANDAHGFFERIDGQIVTGPTLTNVNDFRAIIITPAT